MEFSITNVLAISIPEAILGLYFSFLLILESKYLPFKDDISARLKNVLKLIAYAVITSLANNFFRHVLNSIPLSLVVTMAFALLTIRVLYKLSWYKCLASVLVCAVLYLSVEIVLVPPFVTSFFGSIDAFLNADQSSKMLITLIVRAVQVISIISLWDFKLVFNIIQKYKISKLLFLVLVILLISTQFSYGQQYLTNYASMSKASKVLGGLGCMSCGLLNYMIFLLYIKITQAVNRYLLPYKKGGIS